MSAALFASLLVGSVAIAGCAADSGSNDVEVPPISLDPESSVHFKGGKTAGPVFTDLGLALAASGALSGLGNGDVEIDLSAKGNPKATCTNPGGSTQPPGRNPVEVTLTGTQAIPANEIKNGSLSFSVKTGAPPAVVPGAPGCPNAQWTERIVDVAFTSASLTVQQGGATVLSVTCTFSPATSDGAVPARTVSCVAN
jgi:hypothetical protein